MAGRDGYIGRAPGDSTVIIARQQYTATGVTTDFTFTSGYTVGYVDVYLNGVRLLEGGDYAAQGSPNVGLTSAAQANDIVEIVAYKAFNVGNVTNATGNFDVGEKLTVSGISSLGNVVSSGIVTADSFYGSGANLTNVSSATGVPGINTGGHSVLTTVKASGITTISNTTASTSTTTGALIVSGGVGIAKSLFVGEGISIAGTITYADVTNVDSVGIVTAGKGFRATTGGLIVTAGVSTFSADIVGSGGLEAVVVGTGLSVTGIATFKGAIDANSSADISGGVNLSAGNLKVSAGIVTVGAGVTISSDFIHLGDNKKIQLGIASDLTIQHNATNSVINNATNQLRVAGDDLRLMNKDEDETYATFANDGAASLYHDNTKKVETIGAGVSVYGGIRFHGGGLMREALKIDNTALNSGSTINLSEGMVHYRSAAVGGANVKLNVISTAGINTDMAIGDVMAVTVITVAGSTSHFVDQIRIDGVEASAGVTTNWSGGSVPDAGGGSGIDAYSFNIMKTANATYVVLANQTLTSS